MRTGSVTGWLCTSSTHTAIHPAPTRTAAADMSRAPECDAKETVERDNASILSVVYYVAVCSEAVVTWV